MGPCVRVVRCVVRVVLEYHASGLRVAVPWNANGRCEWSCKWFRIAPRTEPLLRVVRASGVCKWFGMSCKWSWNFVQVVSACRASGVCKWRFSRDMSLKWCLQVVVQVVGRVIDQICKWSCKWFRSDLQVVLMLGSQRPHGLMHMAGDLGRAFRGAAPSSGRATEHKAKKNKKAEFICSEHSQ